MDINPVRRWPADAFLTAGDSRNLPVVKPSPPRILSRIWLSSLPFRSLCVLSSKLSLLLAKVSSCAVIGLDGTTVEVEEDTANGLPSFVIVGLPDATVQENLV